MGLGTLLPGNEPIKKCYTRPTWDSRLMTPNIGTSSTGRKQKSVLRARQDNFYLVLETVPYSCYIHTFISLEEQGFCQMPVLFWEFCVHAKKMPSTMPSTMYECQIFCTCFLKCQIFCTSFLKKKLLVIVSWRTPFDRKNEENS